MSVGWSRLTVGAFLMGLGAARWYFFRYAQSEREYEVRGVNWVLWLPAYITSALWICYLIAWVLWPTARLQGTAALPPGWAGGLRGAGAALLAAGLGLFIYSHKILGHFWNITIDIKEKHKLITLGPYRRIRHPLYTAFFLAYGGSCLTTQTPWLLGLLPFFVWSYLRFAVEEERVLLATFGERYEDYRRRAGMFMFKIRPR